MSGNAVCTGEKKLDQLFFPSSFFLSYPHLRWKSFPQVLTGVDWGELKGSLGTGALYNGIPPLSFSGLFTYFLLPWYKKTPISASDIFFIHE